MKSRSTPRQGGFTLIELMVTTAILLILMVVGFPAMSDLIRDQRVKTGVNELYISLAYARSEAIKRNASVVLTSNTAGNWKDGWTIASGGTTFRNQTALTGVSITGPNSITYGRDGRLSDSTAPTLVVSSSQSTTIKARCVRLDLSGRPNIKQDTNGNAADGCQ